MNPFRCHNDNLSLWWFRLLAMSVTYYCLILTLVHLPQPPLHSSSVRKSITTRDNDATPSSSFDTTGGGGGGDHSRQSQKVQEPKKISMAISKSHVAGGKNNTTPVLESIRIPIDGACSCLDQQQNRHGCCHRAMIGVHKMGITAVQDLLNDYFRRIRKGMLMTEIFEHGDNNDKGNNNNLFEQHVRTPAARDYRHLVVTRDWYDSIISGYLYHKSGRECWLDWFGKPNPQPVVGWLYNNTGEDWERRLFRYESSTKRSTNASSSIPLLRPWPAGNGRDLCRYLADESETDGLFVYAAWAWLSHLSLLWDFRRTRRQWEIEQGWNRTQFLCYEELVQPSRYTKTVFQLYQWFFPHQLPIVNATLNQSTVYRGGHASDPDPFLRRRLRQRLSQIDAESFHGTLAKASQEFGCQASETIQYGGNNGMDVKSG